MTYLEQFDDMVERLKETQPKMISIPEWWALQAIKLTNEAKRLDKIACILCDPELYYKHLDPEQTGDTVHFRGIRVYPHRAAAAGPILGIKWGEPCSNK